MRYNRIRNRAKEGKGSEMEWHISRTAEGRDSRTERASYHASPGHNGMMGIIAPKRKRQSSGTTLGWGGPKQAQNASAGAEKRFGSRSAR